MNGGEDLRARREVVRTALEDVEFEQFAVSLGCAPQRMADLNEEVSSGRRQLQEIDSRIGREETAKRERRQAAAERRRRRIKISDADVDIAFAELLSQLS